MDTDRLILWLLDISGPGCYLALLACALYGVYCVIVLWRKVMQKRMSPKLSAEFMEQLRELIQNKDFDGVTALCDTPRYWSKAFPQLVMLAMTRRDRGLAKCRQFVEEKYEREMLAEMEYRYSWIIAMIKTAPMLGLLGTVTGMVLAFGKLSSATGGGADPQALAGDISLALYTTADGLVIAIPLTILAGMIQTRLSRLTDATAEQLNDFFQELQDAMA
ncbi:MAG: MotA/TolQ/ExbB proton channel family protein [Planctomycetota bacterium]|nr:MAG: MotA/TolQ/ExbB proton channel family protein [Planctomycetota bacterium]